MNPKIILFAILTILFGIGLFIGTHYTKRYMAYEFDKANFKPISNLSANDIRDDIGSTGNIQTDLHNFQTTTENRLNGRVTQKLGINENDENIYAIAYWIGNDVKDEKQKYDGIYVTKGEIILGTTTTFVFCGNIIVNPIVPYTYTKESTFKGVTIDTNKYKSFGIFYDNVSINDYTEKLSKAIDTYERMQKNRDPVALPEVVQPPKVVAKQPEIVDDGIEKRQENIRKAKERQLQVLYNETKGTIVGALDELRRIDTTKLTEYTIKKDFCDNNLEIVKMNDTITDNISRLPDNLKNNIVYDFIEYKQYTEEYNNFMKLYSISKAKKDKWNLYLSKINDPVLKLEKEREEIQSKRKAAAFRRECEERAKERKERYVQTLPPIVAGIAQPYTPR